MANRRKRHLRLERRTVIDAFFAHYLTKIVGIPQTLHLFIGLIFAVHR
jgi:hypothetical protein